MPISALVITLAPSEAEASRALAALAAVPELELGCLVGKKLPAVLETETLSHGHDLVRSLERTPGVGVVDVVSINFEEGVPGCNVGDS